MRALLTSTLVAASLLVGGCGLRPLYASGSKGAVAQVLADVDVAPIAGHEGWLVRNALRDRLQATQGGERARYQLVDSATGEVLLDAVAAQDAGIDVVGSEYATIAAESTALERLASGVADQIVARLAVFANRGGGAPTAQ